MIIKRLMASFGALRNKELILKEKLNIVEAPNEAGKSTWCGFIRAMLYGVNTSERDRMDYLSEKTRFKPWSGAPMEGAMDIAVDGRDISIQRSALGPSPMRKLSVAYSKTGREVLELANEFLGETLTGVSEKVFERSAFIRQAGLKISQTGELEKKISSLVSSGEESVSYTDTDEILRAWLRKRKYNNSGFIPRLEQDLAQVEEMLESLDRANKSYAEISLKLDKAVSRRAELTRDAAVHEELARRSGRRKIVEARSRLLTLETEIKALVRKLTVNDALITKKMVVTARENYDKLGALTVNYTESRETRTDAEKDLALIESEKRSSVFGGLSAAEAKAQVDTATQKNAAAEQATSFRREKYTVSIAVLCVLAIASFAVSAAMSLPLYILGAAALVGAAVSGYLFFKKETAAKSANRARQEIFIRYKCGSIDDLRALLEDYEKLCGKADELRADMEDTAGDCDKVMEELQRRRADFERAAKAFAPEVQNLEEAFVSMSTAEKLLSRLESAEEERTAADQYFHSLASQYDGDWEEPIPEDGLVSPMRNKTETVYELKHIEKELDALKTEYAMAMGEVRAIGDPVVLGAKQNGLLNRRAELLLQYSALEMAVGVLSEASTEIQSRFSPILGRKAGTYIDQLTGGKYKRLLLDKDLVPGTEQFGESITRNILFLSGGTVDQVYLALRLAICEIVLPRENPCPIILDDVLVNFDDARTERVLVLLKALAEERQVVLFTCHAREGAYFAADKSVHIVKL